MAYSLRTDKTWKQTLVELENTFRLWGSRLWKVTPPAPDPRKSWWAPQEAAVTIYFVTREGEEKTFTYGKLDRPVDNLRALYLSLESIRLNEVRGIADVVREMYAALPAPPIQRDPYEVLGVLRDQPIEDIDAMYKIKAKRLHPDVNDSDGEAMKELNAAIERVKAERGAA